MSTRVGEGILQRVRHEFVHHQNCWYCSINRNRYAFSLSPDCYVRTLHVEVSADRPQVVINPDTTCFIGHGEEVVCQCYRLYSGDDWIDPLADIRRCISHPLRKKGNYYLEVVFYPMLYFPDCHLKLSP